MVLKEILTVDELAKAFRFDPRSIYRKVEQREIPYFRIGDRGAIRFMRDEVIKCLTVKPRNKGIKETANFQQI